MPEVTDHIIKVMERPFPPFAEWIQAQSPGTQAEGFEAMTDLAYRSQSQINPSLSPDEASYARMWIGACIACVELCNMEALAHGRGSHEIIATLPRVLATAAMYSMASVAKDETPFREMAKIMTEEFRFAAKVAADALETDVAETGAAKRAAICAGLLAIDVIAEVKFPGQWHQARRAAA